MTVSPLSANPDLSAWAIPAGAITSQNDFQAITIGESVAAPETDSLAGFGLAHTIRPIDLAPPRTTMAIGQPQVQNPNFHGIIFVSSNTLISLSSVDDLIEAGDAQGFGVKLQRLLVDGIERSVLINSTALPLTPQERGQIFISTLTLSSESEGVHRVQFYAQDAADNAESINSLELAIDNTAPATSMSLQGPKMAAFGSMLISPATLISLDAVDPISGGASSGIDFISIKIETLTGHNAGTLGFVPYVSAFSLPEGTHRISFYGVDRLGNAETIKTATVMVTAMMETTLASLTSITMGGNAVIQGSVTANESFNASGNSLVQGSVTAQKIELKGNAVITASQTIASDNVNVEAIDLSIWRALAQANNNNSLIPSKFLSNAILKLSDNDHLMLTTGTYFFNGVKMSGQSQLTIGGLVNIFVTGPIKLSGESEINSGGNPGNMVVLSDLGESIPAMTPEKDHDKDNNEDDKDNDNDGQESQPQARLRMSGQSQAHWIVYAPGVFLRMTGQSKVMGRLLVREARLKGRALLTQETPSGILISKSSSTSSASHETQEKDNDKDRGKDNDKDKDGDKNKAMSISLADAGPDAAFGLREVFVFPNPARQGQKSIFHVETGMAQGLIVTIYDSSGEMLRHRTINESPQIITRASSTQYAYEYTLEEPLPSGVYLYLIEARSHDAALKRTGRFSVVK